VGRDEKIDAHEFRRTIRAMMDLQRSGMAYRLRRSGFELVHKTVDITDYPNRMMNVPGVVEKFLNDNFPHVNRREIARNWQAEKVGEKRLMEEATVVAPLAEATAQGSSTAFSSVVLKDGQVTPIKLVTGVAAGAEEEEEHVDEEWTLDATGLDPDWDKDLLEFHPDYRFDSDIVLGNDLID
jgi:hypothetical protein